jgi:trk system potassium uptake protein TrkA
MKFGVIGLGRFGHDVATLLAENGMEVLAVDDNESIITSIRDNVTQAICLRITDEASLRSIGMDEMDTVIVAMGENIAQSILITALLKKRLQVKKVITRAVNEIHKEILTLVGADQVILPEKEVGIHLADRLSSPFIDLLRITKDFSVSQLLAPKKLVGKKVSDLDLYENYQIYCIGIKDEGEEIHSIDPDHVIAATDWLVFSGSKKNLEKITKL